MVVGLLLALVAILLFAAVRHAATMPPPPPPRPTQLISPYRPPEPPPPAASQPTIATLPPLQETQIREVPVHAIPEPTGPKLAVSREVAMGPSQPAAAIPRQFFGKAKATGAAGLLVGDTAVQLFGIKDPVRSDKCGPAPGTECAIFVQRALAAKFAGGVTISCHVPAPRTGQVVAFAICLDSQGTDLSGYLVGEGLALADTGQSYDYAGAESIARNAKRGLWAYR